MSGRRVLRCLLLLVALGLSGAQEAAQPPSKLSGLAAGTRGAALDKLVTAAIAAQRRRQNFTQLVEAQVVEEAPKALLTSGTGDIATNGEPAAGRPGRTSPPAR